MPENLMTVFAQELSQPHLLTGGTAAERNGCAVGHVRQDKRGGFLRGFENGGFEMTPFQRGSGFFEHFHHRTFLPVLNSTALLYQSAGEEKSTF